MPLGIHAKETHLFSDKPKSGELAKLRRVKETPTSVIVYTADEEAAARADGYGTEYIHQEYPKHVTGPKGETVTVNSIDEELALEGGN
jgi:hypothetical protein